MTKTYKYTGEIFEQDFSTVVVIPILGKPPFTATHEDGSETLLAFHPTEPGVLMEIVEVDATIEEATQ